MKRSILLLGCSAGILAASPADYVNFLRQTQFDTGVQWDVAIETRGSMPSPVAVGELGSLYELWALHGPTGEEIKIDREFVSQYSPEVTVEIETADPYPLVARTRVDQPFTVRVSISDLPVQDINVPKKAKALYFSHEAYHFPEGQSHPDALEDVAPQFSDRFLIEDNGSFSMQFPVTSLSGPDLTKIRGMESFTVSSFTVHNSGHGNNADGVDADNPDGRGNREDTSDFDDEVFSNRFVAGALVERATVEVWPMAEASISGIEANQAYNEVPPFTITLADLYPESTTYLRVYEGPPATSPANAIDIGSACVIVRDSVPRDRSILVGDLDKLLPKQGNYTLEVVHDTPFGSDVLTQFYPLRVDWRIGVRGTIFTND